MDSGTAEVVILLVGLALAALISSIETALVGVTDARVRAAIADRTPGARRLRAWLDAPARILTTLHVLRISGVVAAAVGGSAIARRLAPGLPAPLVILAVALCVLFVAYLAPRTVAKAHAFAWARATILLVEVLTFVLAPIVVPAGALVRAVARLSGVRGPVAPSAFWTPDELGRLAAEAEAGALGKRGRELLRSIIEFSDTVIREIMVPRTDMVVIEVNSSPAEVLRTIAETRHSRVPVYDDTIDNIVGVLHVKELFDYLADVEASRRAVLDLRHTVRPAFYVPEVMKISELLREFQRRKTHMAIVVDEYGGTAGVVTLEDIIEEIVGEIHDEYDVDEKQYRVLAYNKIIADGRVSIWDLGKALSIEFPSDADYETLAGFLVSRVGTLPRAGQVITWGGLRFTVKEADEKRIGTVEIEGRREAAVG